MGFYSPEPRTEVYCVSLNFNISKLVYLSSDKVWKRPQSQSKIRAWDRGRNLLSHQEPITGLINCDVRTCTGTSYIIVITIKIMVMMMMMIIIIKINYIF